MKIQFAISKKETAAMHTDELRENFLVQNLMTNDTIQLVYISVRQNDCRGRKANCKNNCLAK